MNLYYIDLDLLKELRKKIAKQALEYSCPYFSKQFPQINEIIFYIKTTDKEDTNISIKCYKSREIEIEIIVNIDWLYNSCTEILKIEIYFPKWCTYKYYYCDNILKQIKGGYTKTFLKNIIKVINEEVFKNIDDTQSCIPKDILCIIFDYVGIVNKSTI